ncbi:reverse transcriptase domain-containing protein [Tanacetum coccineum]|uniref:Reverse transcriptase domain-containing protein n=1 Tax=Tanacetum coccineum TaxID=301880 RepID=A0ABQ4ZFS7_9ASTR
MRKVLQERGFRNLPSSTKANLRYHVKSISTTVETNTTSIRRIGSTQYVVSASQKSKMFLEPKQVTIPFLSHLYDDCYDEENGSYRLKDLDAYSIRIILRNDTLPQKEKNLGSFTLPCELARTKLTVELADRMVKHPKGIEENVLVGIGKFIFPVDFIILDMPEDVKVPLILGRPFLSTAHAKIDVFTRKITLRVGDEKIIFKSVKLASSLIKRVYMLSLRERMELDLEARLIGEALILNRLLDPLYGDYIELNDLNEPLEFRRNQVNDLEPTIEEGEVVNEPMMDRVETRCDNEIVDGLDEYPSYCDFDKKIHINCTFNLKFSCMIVVDNMDAYRDEGMGDIIVGRPFCKEACIKANQFDAMITIFKGNDDVIYQMARSHPRFKHLTNAQCNKIRPLLKVSAQDKLKGISHPYQKLKGFYKGVLDLGLKYIKDEKVEEWLTRGHISMHGME